MPYRPISDDLKAFAMRLLDRRLVTMKDIVDVGAFSRQTAMQTRWSWLRYGRNLPPKRLPGRRGRTRMIEPWVLYYVEAIYRRSATVTLRELSDALVHAGHPRLKLSTLGRILKRLGLSRKITFKYAREQSAAKRAQFVKEIGLYEPRQLVFIDEAPSTGAMQLGVTAALDKVQRRFLRSYSIEGSITRSCQLARSTSPSLRLRS